MGKGQGMSFKEFTNWVVMALFIWVFVDYGLPLLEARSFEAGNAEAMFVSIVVFCVLYIVAMIVASAIAPRFADQAEDERDRRIALYGERASSFALGAAALMGLAIAYKAGDLTYANIFFLGLVFSEIVKNAWQVALYRLGA